MYIEYAHNSTQTHVFSNHKAKFPVLQQEQGKYSQTDKNIFNIPLCNHCSTSTSLITQTFIIEVLCMLVTCVHTTAKIILTFNNDLHQRQSLLTVCHLTFVTLTELFGSPKVIVLSKHFTFLRYLNTPVLCLSTKSLNYVHTSQPQYPLTWQAILSFPLPMHLFSAGIHQTQELMKCL